MKLQDLCTVELPQAEALTQDVIIRTGAIQHLGEMIIQHIGEPFLCISDPHPWNAANTEFNLEEAFGASMALHLLEEHPKGDRTVVEELAAQAENYAGFVAIGSGTINDLVKALAAQTQKPYVVLGTAVSMNGYASNIAALMDNQLKITLPSITPRAILLDTRIVCMAPLEMAKAGYADLLSRPVSMTDWWVRHQIEDVPYSDLPSQIVAPVFDQILQEAGELPMRTASSFESLGKALVLSGVSMAVAGNSAPASGGEHLISHLWDMHAIEREQPLQLHGAQVGVATCICAALYEQLLSIESPDFAEIPPWESEEERIRTSHGNLAEVVLPEARRKWEKAPLRLQRLRETWPQLRQALQERTLPTCEQVHEWLERAEAPDNLRALGLAPEDAMNALRNARDIRERYTVLDLAYELGYLPGGIDEVLNKAGVD